MEVCCSPNVFCIPARLGQGLWLVRFVSSNLNLSGIDYYTHRKVVGSLRVYFVFYSSYYGTSRLQCFCNSWRVRNLLVMVLRLSKSLKLAELTPTPDCSGPAPTFVPL